MPGMAHLKKRIFYFGQPWPNWSNLQSVWPDDRIKSSPIFPKTCPKSSHNSFFYFKRDPLQKKLSKSPNIWATLVTKSHTKRFQKSPNLVSLPGTCAIGNSVIWSDFYAIQIQQSFSDGISPNSVQYWNVLPFIFLILYGKLFLV